MKVLYQLGSNRFYVNSEQANRARQLDCFSARASLHSSHQRVWTSLIAGMALLLGGAGLSVVNAQDPATTPPDTLASPVQGSRGFGSQVDESMRFGVSARALYEQIEPALVEVLWGGVNSRIHSIAFKVGNEGIYATVIPEGVAKEAGLVLHGGGEELNGEVLAIDERTALCLIKARGNKVSSPPALSLRPMGNRLDPGTLVFGINRPGTGEADVCVAGRLAGRDSIYHGLELPTSFYRINMHLMRGAVGSPVLDESGGVLGILTGRQLKESSEHHALPTAVLGKLLRDHRRAGQSTRAWIGASFHLQSTTPQVMSVRENSPAAQCGLRSGDVILRVGKERVSNLNDLVDTFYVACVGKSLDLEVLRGIEKLSMKLTPGVLPRKAVPASSNDSQKVRGN